MAVNRQEDRQVSWEGSSPSKSPKGTDTWSWTAPATPLSQPTLKGGLLSQDCPRGTLSTGQQVTARHGDSAGSVRGGGRGAFP